MHASQTNTPGDNTVDPTNEVIADGLRFLQGALGNARLYHVEHPEAKRPLALFVDKMNEASRRVGPVLLVTSFEGVFWNGNAVTHESEEYRSVGQLLHREGIARITFLAGLDMHEASRMVDALRVNFSLPEHEEENLESLLWEAELQHVQFQAVSTLMEAEALSGRGADVGQEVDSKLQDFLNDIIEEHSSHQRQNFKQMIDEHQIRQAIHDHDLVLNALDASDVEYDNRFWNEYIDANREEDLLILEMMRLDIVKETEADLLVRVFMLLLRIGLVQRGELPPREAVHFADLAMERLYLSGDVTAVLKIFNEGRRLASQIDPRNTVARNFLHEFYARCALPPLRVAGLLANLDYSNDAQREAAEALIASMPNDGLVALMQWSASEGFNRLRKFYEVLARAAGDRFVQFASGDLSEAGPEILVPLIRVLRVMADPRVVALRARLVAHKSVLVREAALSWFIDDLPDSDIPMVLRALIDRNSSIRRVALEIIRARRPAQVQIGLERALGLERFKRLSEGQREAVCKAYAALLREQAIPKLEALLMTKLPFLNPEPVLEEVILAAAWGLCTVGTPPAMQVLQREADSWAPSARKQICQRVLEAQERRRP